MYMWTVYEKRSVQKTLRKLPDKIVVRYEAWKRIVEIEGHVGLRKITGFRDESLLGKWKGYRSSRLGRKWRVIYHVEKDRLDVFVIEITPHVY